MNTPLNWILPKSPKKGREKQKKIEKQILNKEAFTRHQKEDRGLLENLEEDEAEIYSNVTRTPVEQEFNISELQNKQPSTSTITRNISNTQ